MKTVKEKNDLHGPVKSVHIETAEIKEDNEQHVEHPWYSRRLTFDTAGNITEEIHYNPDGLMVRTVYAYKDDGKLSEIAHYNADGSPGGKRNYEYDHEGQLTGVVSYGIDGTPSHKRTFSYTAEGSIEEEHILAKSEEGTTVLYGVEGVDTSFTAQGARLFKTFRDAQGKPLELLFYDANGMLLQRVEFVYDREGRLIEEIQRAGEVSHWMRCEGDACSAEMRPEELPEEAKAELEALFAPDAPLMKQVHTYDSEGRRIESALTFAGMVAHKRSFAYDDKGNKAEEIYYKEDGSLESKVIFTREYDEHGNWITETVSRASTWDVEFNLSTPLTINRRTITYY